MRFNEYSREASLRRRRAQRSSARRRRAAGLLALALAGALAVGGTFAWLTSQSESVVNTFSPATVTTEIDEDITSGDKENICVENTGDVPVYVRAQVVVNWIDGEGNIAASVPENYQYAISPDPWPAKGSGWVEGTDGFFYYTAQLAEKGKSGFKTKNLINAVTSKVVLADGEEQEYFLSVEILSEAIQALPDDAFNDAWGGSSGLTASNGKLAEKTTA